MSFRSLSIQNIAVIMANTKANFSNRPTLNRICQGILAESCSGHPLSWFVVCIDKWRQQINVQRHVNHHPLSLQLHPRAVGHQSSLLFSAPTAGLASGAAGLTDWEVTTRGQPHVVFIHRLTGRAETSAPPPPPLISWHAVSFLALFVKQYTKSLLLSVLKLIFSFWVDRIHFILSVTVWLNLFVGLKAEFCVFYLSFRSVIPINVSATVYLSSPFLH